MRLLTFCKATGASVELVAWVDQNVIKPIRKRKDADAFQQAVLSALVGV